MVLLELVESKKQVLQSLKDLNKIESIAGKTKFHELREREWF